MTDTRLINYIEQLEALLTRLRDKADFVGDHMTVLKIDDVLDRKPKGSK